MKKNAVLSVITLLLCFMIGYVAYETSYLVKSWVTEKFSTCKDQNDPRCAESNQRALRSLQRR